MKNINDDDDVGDDNDNSNNSNNDSYGNWRITLKPQAKSFLKYLEIMKSKWQRKPPDVFKK